MSISTGGTDIMGGGAGYGFGGFGGIAPIGLIGLNTFLGRGGFGDGFGVGGAFPGAGLAGTTVADQNISELRKDVQGVNTTVESLGNELQGAIFNQTLGQTAQFNNLGDLVMNGFSQSALAAKDATIQSILNTQSIKDQASAFQVINQENFCSVKSLISAEGDKTRDLITQNLIDGLRSELLQERRGRDNREVEINIANTATATQAQVQGQLQAQTQLLANSLNLLGDQVNRAQNSIVNLGTMTASGQTNANTNVKA